MAAKTPQRLIVGISGASGVVYGVRMLEVLRDVGVETGCPKIRRELDVPLPLIRLHGGRCRSENGGHGRCRCPDAFVHGDACSR